MENDRKRNTLNFMMSDFSCAKSTLYEEKALMITYLQSVVSVFRTRMMDLLEWGEQVFGWCELMRGHW